jgi:hypothetical protein
MRANIKRLKTIVYSVRFDLIHRLILEKYAAERKTNQTVAIREIILDWASRTDGFSSMLFFTDEEAWKKYAAEIELVRDMAINLLNGSTTFTEYSPKLFKQVCDEAEKLLTVTGKLKIEEVRNLTEAKKLFNHEI